MKDKNSSYKGFEILLNTISLKVKMLGIMIAMTFLVQLVACLLIVYLFYYKEAELVMKYAAASLKAIAPGSTVTIFQDGRPLKVSSIAFVKIARPYVLANLKQFMMLFLYTALIYPLGFIVIRKYLRGKTKEQIEGKHIRGSRLISSDDLNKQMAKNNEQVDLPIGELRQPVRVEPEHTFVVGRAGTGKTQCIGAVLARLKQRQGKGIIYSYKADDYLCKFFSPDSDLIFNPLDRRCIGWNIFNEIETQMDIDAIAASLIPTPANTREAYFYNTAREVFVSILLYLYKNNLRTNADIWNMITIETAMLADLLKNTQGCEAGYKHIEDPESKTTKNIISTLIEHTTCFRYMTDINGDFRIQGWLENNNSGFIFIANNPDAEATLRPVISLFIDLLMRRLLALSDDRDRRIFFFLDELGTLQKLTSITKLITLSRSKGGCAWLGIQDIGQIDEVYGYNLRQTIINSCGTSVILAAKDPQTAEYLSNLIGDQERLEKMESVSFGRSVMRDGNNIAEQVSTSRLIMPSELTSMPALTALVKFPGYDWSKTNIPVRNYPVKTEALVVKEGVSLNKEISEPALAGMRERL